MKFDTRFKPEHGQAVKVAPGVVRVTAKNPSPFTFHGTNSYIVGSGQLAVIDPGPDDDAHLEALLRAIDGRPVSHILVTHTHRDHSPLAARLQAATGAATAGEGPHRASRTLHVGETGRLDASGDVSFRPDIALADAGAIDGDGWRLVAVHTPGHAANHMAYELEGTGTLFSGDHVMAWSTTIVAPPDGSMTDYMASLEKLLARVDGQYLPGHGGAIAKPRPYLLALKAHRTAREHAILESIRGGDRSIAEMVRQIYRDTDQRLHAAAAMSVFAHLEALVAAGLVVTDGEPALGGEYRPG
jgi:glyoxylase-like metal-dependent hydrolase (beta-lactamase superfamily II)